MHIYKDDYFIYPLDKKIAKTLIIKHHYSHKWTSCRYALGLYKHNSYNEIGPFKKHDIVGVAIYGFPIGRQVVKSISPVLENKDVLELTRLWVNDDEICNAESYFIGQTFKWLKANTNIKVLISYSDPMYGHIGTIYQATNWLYQGNNTMLVKGYTFEINGLLMHPRTVVSKYGSVKDANLKSIDPNYKRIPLKKKHRYIYLLDKKSKKSIMSTLKHPIIDYPKDNDDTDW